MTDNTRDAAEVDTIADAVEVDGGTTLQAMRGWYERAQFDLLPHIEHGADHTREYHRGQFDVCQRVIEDLGALLAAGWQLAPPDREVHIAGVCKQNLDSAWSAWEDMELEMLAWKERAEQAEKRLADKPVVLDPNSDEDARKLADAILGRPWTDLGSEAVTTLYNQYDKLVSPAVVGNARRVLRRLAGQEGNDG